MPGYELVGREELEEIQSIFRDANGVMFRQGFDNIRNGIFKVNQFETQFAEKMSIKHALAVTSGTAALKVALKASGVRPGDEVITQAFTFVATVEAIVECGAVPVIVDIDATLNMDPVALERAITRKTKAIIPVHMLGVPARMDVIMQVADAKSIVVIEDTAWGCGGKFKGQSLGTIGHAGCFSFDYAKAITTGEGGMVVTNSTDLDFRARAYQDHGHENNPSVKRWEDTRHGSGFNYRMTEMQGAFGLAQLRKLDAIIASQRELSYSICTVLREFGDSLHLRPVPVGSEPTGDAVVFGVESPEKARECRDALVNAGLGTKILPEAVTWHFAGTWTHIPELVAALGGDFGKLDHSARLLAKSVALPINLRMPSDYHNRLYEALKPILRRA
jgi:8-amino-3,8-dideoxy-alpha-D-manno-octulosonate transaminase